MPCAASTIASLCLACAVRVYIHQFHIRFLSAHSAVLGPGHWPGACWKLALGPGLNLPGPGRLIGLPWLMESWVAQSPPRQSHAHLFWKLLVAKQWDVKGRGNPRGMGQTGAQMTGQMFVGFGESGAGHPQPRLTPAWLPGKPTGSYLLVQLPC